MMSTPPKTAVDAPRSASGEPVLDPDGSGRAGRLPVATLSHAGAPTECDFRAP